VLLAAEGLRNEQIQERLKVSKPVVIKWRRRFAAQRLAGLVDQPGRGRKRKYDPATRHRIAATACSTPPESVGTHWSVRTLARHLGVGVSVVQSVLSAESIQPHRFRYWKDSNDPEFEPKMLAVVGLYMQPPQNAVVLSVDEKTSIQALDRTQPRLPMKPHRIERLSHEYKRHGTASLLASLEVHSGQVHAEPIQRNNSATFIRFLRHLLNAYPAKELHIIADNGSSHRSKKTLAWVAKQKRLHLAFTPTHASWLNQIEIWFGILTRKIVRRGIFKSRHELVERLMNFITTYNQEARPFQWTYTGNPLAA
jgi:putative transposase